MQIDKLRDSARKKLEQLTDSASSDSLATSLNEIAKAAKVGAIRFAPILGTAGLLRTESGFDIVLDSDDRSPNHKTGKIWPVESSDWNLLPSPFRFSVAHELAQALIVKWNGGDPNKDFFLKHEEAIDHLCNELAGKLLVPARKLIRELDGKTFSAINLKKLTTEFGVSAEAFARRLQYLDIKDAFLEGNGLISFIRAERSGGETLISEQLIRFVAGRIWGPTALGVFGLGPAERKDSLSVATKFPAGRSVDDLKLSINLVDHLTTKEQASEACEAFWGVGHPKKILLCNVEFDRTSADPLSFLLTINVAAAPMEPA